MLEILPGSLYTLSNIEVILDGKTSAIMHKTLSENLVDKKMYLSSVAILFLVKGKQVIQSYEGSDLVVNEQEVVLLPKDLYVVSDFVTDSGVFEAVIFFVDDQLIKKFMLHYSIGKIEKEANSTVVKLGTSGQVREYIRSLRDVYSKQAGNAALLEIKILEFLLLVQACDSKNLFMPALMSPIKKRDIKKFMEDNYLANLKIDDYAALTGRSVSTFIREFKRLYKTTPNKWLINRRISKAHDLLCDTNMNVTQVSMEVGYENVSHFIKVYKEIHGVTPKSAKNKKSD